jgi:mono/diheme cytochrome c family protein
MPARNLLSEQRVRATGLLFTWALAGAGCAQDADSSEFGFATGPMMQPGDNCLRCHRDERTDYPSAPVWTAGGTVFPGPDSPTGDGIANVAVIFSDVDGGVIETLMTNAAGNFYTPRELPLGFRVALEYEGERIEMPCAPPSGGCAACHTEPAIGGAPGRLFIPQAPEADDIASECAGF